jgi:beta-glucosidase
VADVVIAKADGTVNHDFKGKLSFSWPSSPMQTPLNVGQVDYQPLFPYGYGLSYAEPKELAVLDESIADNSAQITASLAIFNQRPVEPWQLVLLDNLNNMTLLTTSKGEVSTLSVSAVDHKVQEDARRAVWNGTGKGTLSFSASQRTDLTTYAEQKAALIFDYKVNQKPTDAVSIGMNCGTDCETFVDVTNAINSEAEGEWVSLAIPLECYSSKRVKMDMVMAPFVITTQGRLDITLYNLRVEKSDSAIACPAQ